MGSLPPDPMAALAKVADSILGTSDAAEPFVDQTKSDAEKRAEGEERVRLLFKRIEKAKKKKKKWEDDFEVDRSHDYVKGFQRPKGEELDAQQERRYQLNRILAALKAKIPTMFYYNPYVRIRVARGREDAPGQTATKRANLLQDTVNTIVKMRETRLKPECLLGVKEAQYAFGIAEVGYEAEWGENPYARKPVLIENDEVRSDLETMGAIPEEDSLAEVLSELEEVPTKETFFVRHIPARQFLVSNPDKPSLEAQDWVAYWEWMYVEDVKRCPSFENTEDLAATASSSGGHTSPVDPELGSTWEPDEEVPPDMVRVWKLWDQREMRRYVIAEGHDAVLKRSKFWYLPLFDLRLEIMPGEWYPIPPVFMQLTEQDEHNDSREYLRLVRKALRPRFTYDKMAFDPDELEKLETDEIGVFVAVKNQNPNPINPIQQPSLSENSIRTLGFAESGFSEVSGVSAQQRLTRSAGGKPTATEVNDMAAKTDIRESYEQQAVADWLARIADGLLKCAIERMSLTQWVKMNSDPHSPQFGEDAASIAETWQEITGADLEEAAQGLSWDVTVDIESLSPVSEAQQAQRNMQALQMLASPGVGRLLSLSPPLLRIQLNMMGIRNESDIQAILLALQKRDELEREMNAMNAPSRPAGGPQPPGPPGPQPGQGGMPPLPPSVQAAIAKGQAPGNPPRPGTPTPPPGPPGGTPAGGGAPAAVGRPS